MYVNLFRKRDNHMGGNLLSLFFGAAIGAAAVGLSQKQNRDKVNDVVNDVKRRSQKAIDSFKEDAQELKMDAKEEKQTQERKIIK